MKKLKKLKLNKEVVANLSNGEMSRVKGGAPSAVVWVCTGVCGGGGGSPSAACTKPPRCCDYGCCETLYC